MRRMHDLVGGFGTKGLNKTGPQQEGYMTPLLCKDHHPLLATAAQSDLVHQVAKVL